MAEVLGGGGVALGLIDPLNPAIHSAMAKVAGRFWFKCTSNGNLVGEFSNEGSRANQVEAADRVRPGGDWKVANTPGFEGCYQSVWVEDGGEAVVSGLSILPKPYCAGIYSVKWEKRDGSKRLFEGEAMICEEMLIGNYWSA